VANYVRLLEKGGWNVDLIVIGETRDNASECPEHEAVFLSKSRNSMKAFLLELTLRAPYFSNFDLSPLNWMEHYISQPYNMILCSPISMVATGAEICEFQKSMGFAKPELIAAISDCYTEELRNVISERKVFGISMRTISRIRSSYMHILENKILSHADRVFVQSHVDKACLEELSNSQLSGKVEVVTNGVDEGLFLLPISKGVAVTKFCFIADFRVPDYRQKLNWLYTRVWKNFDVSGKKLFLHGKGLSLDDSSCIDILKDPTVEYSNHYVEDLCDLYKGMDVAYAPIFRRHGFINKVGEAVAAGIIVIGDQTAFGAIPNFVSGENCIIANTDIEMVAASEHVCQDIEYSDRLKVNGRKLAEENLKWSYKEKIFDLG